ncbi:MAG: GAF domain-containing protein [Thermoleophilaceae bacterium]
MARPPHVPQPDTELEEFFDLSIDPLSIIGFDGKYKRVNAAFLRLMGYTQAELSSRSVLDDLHPDDVEPAREALAQVLEGHDVVGFEARVICANGAVRWLEWSTRTMPERGVIYGIGRDTTERHRAEAELREAQQAIEASRDELRVLADEQAALRRVATLVAQDVGSTELFGAVTGEVGALLGADIAGMLRYEDDGTATSLATWAAVGEHPPVPERWPIEPGDPAWMILESRAPARVDDWASVPGPIAEAVRSGGMRSSVGSPIIVEGQLWGAMAVHSKRSAPLPADTEARLEQFAELVATAIANAEARTEVERLATEQSALRRVATLVAEGASPSAVLDGVAAEMERALGADAAMLFRYEPDQEATVVARSASNPQTLSPGTRLRHEGENVISMVRRTGRPARIADYERAGGYLADLARAAARNIRSAVGAPIVLDGRLWGVIIASWGERSPPGDTEERMAEFAQLLATAIANAESSAELISSRARLLTAGDEARRRVVRDLHDGAQQRLVHTIVTLKLAQRALGDEDGEAKPLLSEALEQAEQGNRELRELAHGILPAVLTRGGLRAGVDAVVARLNLPVRVDVPAERLPAEIEANAYFIVAEALTNVVKHSRARSAEVTASVDDGALRVEVCDDGIGGADPAGHGLVGLADRATALGGRLEIESSASGGTVVTATLPVNSAPAAPLGEAGLPGLR